MRHRAIRTGFTLLEMMLVVVIMGILGTVVIVSFGGRTEAARIEATKTKMKQIQTALATYEATHAAFPPNLDALATGTTKYITSVPKDAWNKSFQYYYPSSRQNPDQPYDLYSVGKDGLPNTPDDVDIWTLEAQGTQPK